MKYLFFFLLFTATLSSCVTEFTCSCTGDGVDFQSEITASTQSDADLQCSEIETNAEATSSVDITCSLR